MKNKVAEKRKELNISQEKLAELSGVSRTSIANLEQCKVDNISLKSMKALSKVLKTPMVELFFFR